MASGHIVVHDTQVGEVRHILGGTLFEDGFLFLDRIEDTTNSRKFKSRLVLTPTELKEFYKQLKELMEE